MAYLGNQVAPLVQALEGKELKLDSDGDSSITADTDDQIDFKTGGTDRLQIQSTAGNNVVIADGLTLTNGNIALASGHGISFSATSDASGMTSELLHDYEEGTWTPVLTLGGATTGINYSQQTGRYTRVGDVVHVFFVILLSSKGSASGNGQITGFPFSVGVGNTAGTIYQDRISITGPMGIYTSSGTDFTLYNQGSGANSNVADGSFADNSYLAGNITYPI